MRWEKIRIGINCCAPEKMPTMTEAPLVCRIEGSVGNQLPEENVRDDGSAGARGLLC
jgi:hypothetical protein